MASPRFPGPPMRQYGGPNYAVSSEEKTEYWSWLIIIFANVVVSMDEYRSMI